MITLTSDWHLVPYGPSDRGMEDCRDRGRAVETYGREHRSPCRVKRALELWGKKIYIFTVGVPKSQRPSARRVSERLFVVTVIIFQKVFFFAHIFANEVCGESEEFIIAGCHAACAV